MARIGIVFGLLLCGLSAIGMMGTSTKSPIQFIPMMLGIPILFCGVVGLNPHRRKQSMQAAAAIALLGAVAGAVRATYIGIQLAGGAPINRYAWILVVAMTLVCTIFVAVCTITFVQLRRRKIDLVHTVEKPGPRVDLPIAHEPSTLKSTASGDHR